MQPDDRYRQQPPAPPAGSKPSYAPPQWPAGPSATQPVPPGWQQQWPGPQQGSYGDAPLIHPAAAQQSSATSYGVPVYRSPVVAYAPAPTRTLSITALVLGLCSATFAWTIVVVPLIGLVFGFLALRREPGGRALAITGLVTSAVGVLWVLLVYLLPLLLVVAAATMSFGR